MTTCIAATDALAIAAWISVAVAQFDWNKTVESITAQSLVQQLLGLMIAILCVALVPAWFGGQLYIAVKLLQQLLSDVALALRFCVKWDGVFTAALLVASLAQFVTTLPTQFLHLMRKIKMLMDGDRSQESLVLVLAFSDQSRRVRLSQACCSSPATLTSQCASPILCLRSRKKLSCIVTGLKLS